MDLGLKGKTAIVTGGARGIGRAIALTLGDEGTNVVIGDLDEERGARVADEIASKGAGSLMVRTDVTKLEDAKRLAQATLDKFGDIDLLVNDAGVWVIKRFAELTPQEWDKEISVCYYGVLNCVKAIVDYMIEQKKGNIISIASDAGRVGEPNEPVYSGAKAAVIGFTKGLAKDLGRYGIRVNAVAPSMTWNDEMAAEQDEAKAKGGEDWEKYGARMTKILKFYPLRKLGIPQDVADMVVFLASERCGHITGQTISVNGGYCMI